MSEEHVALTGGCLYREGSRKDCDLVFYRVRQVEFGDLERTVLLNELAVKLDLVCHKYFGWGEKAFYKNKSVDLFFPEFVGDDDAYPEGQDTPDLSPLCFDLPCLT